MTAIEFNQHLIQMDHSMRSFARTLTRSQEEINDLIQDTYLKALRNRDKYVNHTNFRAWLFTIMKNIFINNYRRSKMANTWVDTTEDLYYLNNSKAAHEMDPEGVLSEMQILEKVEKLPDEQRVPFEMHRNGYKYQEIADELNLSIGTVKSRIFFSRKKLMQNLKEYQN